MTPLDKLAQNVETGSTARIKINKAIAAVDTNVITLNEILARITNIQHDTNGKTNFTAGVKYDIQPVPPKDEADKRASTEFASVGNVMSLLDEFSGDTSSMVRKFEADPSLFYPKDSLISRDDKEVFKLTTNVFGGTDFPYTNSNPFPEYLAPSTTLTWKSDPDNPVPTRIRLSDETGQWSRGYQNGDILYDRTALHGGFAWYTGGNHSDTSWDDGGGEIMMGLNKNKGLHGIDKAEVTVDQNLTIPGNNNLVTKEFVNNSARNVPFYYECRAQAGGVVRRRKKLWNTIDTFPSVYLHAGWRYRVELIYVGFAIDKATRQYKLMLSYPNKNILGSATYKVHKGNITKEQIVSINVVNLAPTETAHYTIALKGFQDRASGHWWRGQGGTTLKITRIGV